jgi:hypothetical protein
MSEKHCARSGPYANLEIRFIGDVDETIAGYITPSPIK